MTELRLHPRVPSALMAELTNSHGATLAAKIHDLSPGGLMLDGGQELKTLLFKDLPLDKDPLSHPVEVDIRIQLPGQQQGFFSHARLVYIRRQSEHQYSLGLRYVAISSTHAMMMESHILGGEPIQDPLNRAFNPL